MFIIGTQCSLALRDALATIWFMWPETKILIITDSQISNCRNRCHRF